jgi:hypothetical protein
LSESYEVFWAPYYCFYCGNAFYSPEERDEHVKNCKGAYSR